MSTQLLIAGNDKQGTKTAVRNNPVTEQTATTYAAATVADCREAVAAAKDAFGAWSNTGPGERRAILNKAADALEARKDAIIETMVRETGATKGWAGFNVMLGAGIFRETAANTTQMTGETIPSNRPGTTALAIRRPIGPVVGIAPWNAPVILGVRAVAVAIACGNTAVFKGSEMCPQTHRYIVDVLVDAGCPDGVINYINNDPEDAPAIVEALVTDPAIRHVNFTGSTRVGKVIASLAAQGLKPALLELGGKAPFVVLKDADLDEAVNGAVFSAFFNQGQICMSTERIILEDAIADDFAERFANRVRSLSAGDPSTTDAPLGAVVSSQTVDHLHGLLDDARSKGARILVEGEVNGVVMQPSIVDQVTPEMKLWHDESFGPIVAITRASGDDELVRLANDTEYGLSSSVYGRDMSRLMNIAGAIESGICHINAPTVYDEPQMPFGGVKSSGYGRFGGRFGVDAFSEVRWVTINSKPVHLPI